MSRSFKLLSHTAFLCIVNLLLNEAVGKHFKQSLPEGDKNLLGGRGRKGNQVSACQNNEKKNVEACGGGGGGGVVFTEPNEMTPERNV